MCPLTDFRELIAPQHGRQVVPGSPAFDEILPSLRRDSHHAPRSVDMARLQRMQKGVDPCTKRTLVLTEACLDKLSTLRYGSKQHLFAMIVDSSRLFSVPIRHLRLLRELRRQCSYLLGSATTIIPLVIGAIAVSMT